jgi:molecular chaperone DnaK (HSP70)
MREPTLDDHRDIEPAEDSPAITVATDFGTTFSCVAFTKGDRENVQIISGYPGDPGTEQQQGEYRLDVPSELWYPNDSTLQELALQYDGQSDEEMGGMGDEQEGEDDHRSVPLNQTTSSTPPIFWGFAVHQKLLEPFLDKSGYNCIARPKLLLDNSQNTKRIRAELKPVLKRLKARKTINNNEDVIAHYLQKLFEHAKWELKNSHGLSAREIERIEHVVCVPVIWSWKSLRGMENAMKVAIERSGLGTNNNLFLISEPEAAAARVRDPPRHTSLAGNYNHEGFSSSFVSLRPELLTPRYLRFSTRVMTSM